MSQYILVIPDTHIPSHDPLAVDVIDQVIRANRPDRIVHLGDLLDCASVSHFVRNFPLDQVELPTLWQEFDEGERVLTRWMESSRGCEWDWIEGNHEYRIKQLERSLPALRGGVSIPSRFQTLISQGLRFHETWKGDEKHGVPLKLGRNVLLLHGRRYSKYHARWMADDYAPWTVMYGHVHDQNSYTRQNFRAPGASQWSAAYSAGHIARPRQSYIGHYATNWQQGFGEVTVDDEGWGHVTLTPIQEGRCVYRGRTFDAAVRRALVSVPEALRTPALARQAAERPEQIANVIRRAEAALAPLGWAGSAHPIPGSPARPAFEGPDTTLETEDSE